ncbi:MAG: hypothetical protein LUH02_02670 [Erysipelotrichaceae bacterium]|nr:hypothetical protein [Erysipelotrichaceae bacterium]
MELNLKLREKDKIVKEIIEKYKRAQLNILFLDQHYNYYPQPNLFKIKETSTPYNIGESSMLAQLQKKQRLEAYVLVVEQIHSCLSESTLDFVNHQYLNFYDPHWWEDKYSRSSYYRVKNNALDEYIATALQFYSLKDLCKMLED